MSVTTLQQPITFAVLGDSAASGIGDADSHGTCRGWAYYLANAFCDPTVYINIARPGAKSEEVKELQLARILPLRPTITAVIVGGNDLLRNGFDPRKIHENLSTVTRALKEVHSEVLLMQFHDVGRIVPLPYLIRRVLQRRADALNEVTEEIAKEFGTIFVKVRDIADVYHRNFWHVDRMHPSTQGHQVLAQEFAHHLAERQWEIAPIPLTSLSAPSKLEGITWMIRNGVPWFFKRSIDLLPAMIFLSAVEIFRIVGQSLRVVILPTQLQGKIDECNRPTPEISVQPQPTVELTLLSGRRRQTP